VYKYDRRFPAPALTASAPRPLRLRPRRGLRGITVRRSGANCQLRSRIAQRGICVVLRPLLLKRQNRWTNDIALREQPLLSELYAKVGKLGETERKHVRKHVRTKSFDSRCQPAVSDLQLIDRLFGELSYGSQRTSPVDYGTKYIIIFRSSGAGAHGGCIR